MATEERPVFNQEKLVFSVTEAGALLGLGRNKAYALAKDGTMPTMRLHGRIVVPRGRFMAWLDSDNATETDKGE